MGYMPAHIRQWALAKLDVKFYQPLRLWYAMGKVAKHKKTTPSSKKRAKLHGWRRWLVIIASVIVGLVALNYLLNNVVFQPVANPSYGVSFSIKQASQYKTDWKANYTALLDDLGFKRLRLMSHWNLIEPDRGQISFSDLDWQMDEAAKRGATVILSVGLRQPRWPECHPPAWARQLSGHEFKQALYAYMELVVNRYKNHPALGTWQLENEAMNNWFGECELDRERVIEEFNLIRQWDPIHQIHMTLSDEHGLPLGDPKPDAYGFTMYRIVYSRNLGTDMYMLFPASVWWHRLRAAVITLIHHKPLAVHELQMEPWGPTENYNMSTEEQDKSMGPTQIGRMTDFARRSGFRELDLWGAEWWYWRKSIGDDSIWETVRQTINKR